jgi:hypothetical protein
MEADPQTLFLRLLVFGVCPLWLAAGFADWLCHRRTVIERTSGAPESAFHLALYGLIAVPAILALYFEITAAVLAVATAGVLAHSLLSWWDTAYSQPRRLIGPVEQIVHSHLEMLPVFALAIVIVMFWNEVREPRWTLTPRAVPMSPRAQLVALGALFAGLALILEELVRCLRVPRLSGVRPAPPR